MQSERRLLEARIARLVQAVPEINDDELRAELTKYLCVLASGLLEVSCRDILTRYALRRSAPPIQRFVAARLSDFQSAKVGNIIELLQCFDPGGASRWRASLSDEEADSIDSIVNNRHQIAHGRSIGLSFNVLVRYHEHASRALTLIEDEFPST